METPKAILFVTSGECAPGPSPALASALAKAGYQVKMADISEIEDIDIRYTPAMAIAGLSGRREEELQTCHRLIRSINAPLIVISPLDDVDVRIAALDSGIVDYLVSPISPLIVAARVKSILQRWAQNPSGRDISSSPDY